MKCSLHMVGGCTFSWNMLSIIIKNIILAQIKHCFLPRGIKKECHAAMTRNMASFSKEGNLRGTQVSLGQYK